MNFIPRGLPWPCFYLLPHVDRSSAFRCILKLLDVIVHLAVVAENFALAAVDYCLNGCLNAFDCGIAPLVCHGVPFFICHCNSTLERWNSYLSMTFSFAKMQPPLPKCGDPVDDFLYLLKPWYLLIYGCRFWFLCKSWKRLQCAINAILCCAWAITPDVGLCENMGTFSMCYPVKKWIASLMVYPLILDMSCSGKNLCSLIVADVFLHAISLHMFCRHFKIFNVLALHGAVGCGCIMLIAISFHSIGLL